MRERLFAKFEEKLEAENNPLRIDWAASLRSIDAQWSVRVARLRKPGGSGRRLRKPGGSGRRQQLSRHTVGGDEMSAALT